MIKVLTISGTRPEAIKIAPVIRELKQHSDMIQTVNCSTGQHKELLKGIFDLFDVNVDYELNVMVANQTLPLLTSKLFNNLANIFEKVKPDWVLAQGDTTTVMVASVLAYYNKIKFGHIEAGLRTGNLYAPFPEEGNRLISDAVAHKLWAPTQKSADNLLLCGFAQSKISVTGNTVIDALRIVSEISHTKPGPILSRYTGKKIVLVTAHRRESFGKELEDIFNAIKDLALIYQTLTFVFPVHFNPNVRNMAKKILGGVENIDLIEPLDYLSFINLIRTSFLILTDSGGIQEEAPYFNVPVLVLRNLTERPEGIEAGTSLLIGTERNNIVKRCSEVIENKNGLYSNMVEAKNPYGDGFAADRIVRSIIQDEGNINE